MSDPEKQSRLQLLEKLDTPGSVPPWKWIGLGAAGVLVLGGVILLIVLGVSSSSGRKPAAATQTQAQTPAPPNPDEAPITGSRARPTVPRVAARPRPNARPEPAVPLRTADGMLLVRGAVASGTPLITTIKRAGASAGNALGMLKALGEHFNLRRARPGHKFVLHVDPKTRMPVYFRYHVSLARVYEVRRAGDRFEARPVKVKVTKRILRYAGMVGISLGAELAARGAHPALLSRILGVLTSQPKFFKAQRFGDFFRILVEEELVAGHHLRFGPVLALEYNSARSGLLRLYHLKTGKAPGKYYTDKGVSLPSSRLHIPVHYTRVSSPFGYRFHPVLKRRKLHAGTDFVAPPGTPVRATLPGKVLSARRHGAFGNLVIVDHGEGLLSYYAHLLRFRRGLKRGQKVRARFVIGYVGSTGRSTGPHLHFGLKLSGKWIDPLAYRLAPGRPAPVAHRGRLKRIIAKRRRQLAATLLLGAFRLPARISTKDEVITGVEEP